MKYSKQKIIVFVAGDFLLPFYYWLISKLKLIQTIFNFIISIRHLKYKKRQNYVPFKKTGFFNLMKEEKGIYN